MKKNMLTVIILALGVVNLILTGLLVFVALPSFSKTNKLMTQVSSMIELELEYPNGNVPADVTVPLEDQDPYALPKDSMIVNLKKSSDGTAHIAKFSCSVSMNTKSDKYSTLSTKIESHVTAIEEIIARNFARYTMEELETNEGMATLKQEILAEFAVYFDSDFIVNISFGGYVAQ